MNKIQTLLLCSVAMAASAHAVVLTGEVFTSPETTTNLTTGGELDWAIWDTTSSTKFTSIAATNVKSGGADIISPIKPFSTTVVATNEVRGVGGAIEKFTYTDGVSPTSQTAATIGFVTNGLLATAGRGVQFDVTGDAGQLYRVDVWATGFAGTGEMRASLNGASTVVLDSQTYGTNGSSKAPTLFSFEFMPDSDLDLLTISYHLKANGIGASAHVGIQAVTVTAIPEPATYALLVGALGLGLAMVRRRRRA